MVELPKGAAGEKLCDWCGKVVAQPPTGRRRKYCSQSCRELAYRERRLRRLIGEAVENARQESSVDEREGEG